MSRSRPLLTHPVTITAITASALLIIIYQAQAADPTSKQSPNAQDVEKDTKNNTDKTDRDDPKGMVTAHIVRLKKTQPSLMDDFVTKQRTQAHELCVKFNEYKGRSSNPLGTVPTAEAEETVYYTENRVLVVTDSREPAMQDDCTVELKDKRRYFLRSSIGVCEYDDEASYPRHLDVCDTEQHALAPPPEFPPPDYNDEPYRKGLKWKSKGGNAVGQKGQPFPTTVFEEGVTPEIRTILGIPCHVSKLDSRPILEGTKYPVPEALYDEWCFSDPTAGDESTFPIYNAEASFGLVLSHIDTSNEHIATEVLFNQRVPASLFKIPGHYDSGQSSEEKPGQKSGPPSKSTTQQ